ncbi:MAG: hypothetical protein ACO3S3_12000, partial [Pseudohongiellaceae bacterium]
MGANAQTSVPTFTAGEVLTAANMNISARTGIPVFADDTARDAAFGGTGEKTLAEGQFAYLEDSNTTQYYDGAAWQAVGGASGLTLISATTIGTTVASVTVSSAFSATYDNYLITVSGGVASTNNSLVLTLGATVTGYYYSGSSIAYSATTYTGTNGQNAANWGDSVRGSTNSLNGQIFLYGPNLAKNTHFSSIGTRSDTGGGTNMLQGYLANTTQYTAFTLTTNTGTVTGGTIRVYGLANS